MKNNSEIVNNTMCKSCLREHKEMTGHEPIDCAFKAFDNEYCEEAQELADYITNQDTKRQKLKEWLNDRMEHYNDCLNENVLISSERQEVLSARYNQCFETIAQMEYIEKELEGEDDL